ncbi:sugar phosphate isomerase/epimerase family protein [Actinomadura opuntiae]|uniref:sugar phosphate isomerase/epimerase family protein n=1 Tax=Actinomadura sp. OS1-43 TaxID=604315 RepID=UPI00255AE75D|nr:sugar phosphate isomerase/epimerase family protein [Actinomadura sp. OS1-43]MDL4816951.1 sugar phosphate isomerase/epimerase family protein [Actinomadura sp. OS1-43]
MRLAVINDEVDQDLGRAADAAAGCGFAGIEVRSVGNVPPHELTDGRLAEVVRELAGRGLAVAGFCPPALKVRRPRTEEEYAAARAVLVRAVAQARVLGAPHVRIFTFYRDGDPDPAGAAEAARRVLDGVDLDGVKLLVETGTRTNTPTMELVLRFLEAVDVQGLGVLWDPGNSVFSGMHPTPFPAEYELGKDLIEHVHVKDPAGTSGYVRLGDGDLPWGGIVDALRADGYAGWLSLETHWRIGRVLNQRQRDTPWGDDFTDGGYEASVECMRRLKELVDR